MKKTTPHTTLKNARLALMLGVAALVPMTLVSCEIYTDGHSEGRRGHDRSRGDDYYSDNYFYTCSMHGEVRRSGPGNCPRCGMGLIKVHVHDNRR